ncbi:unnamed protein product, partial [Arctia plantaginis]
MKKNNLTNAGNEKEIADVTHAWAAAARTVDSWSDRRCRPGSQPAAIDTGAAAGARRVGQPAPGHEIYPPPRDTGGKRRGDPNRARVIHGGSPASSWRMSGAPPPQAPWLALAPPFYQANHS